MRGRTNVTQRSGTVPVNGQIKEAVVESGNVISVGDFVSYVFTPTFENITNFDAQSKIPTSSDWLWIKFLGKIGVNFLFFIKPYSNSFNYAKIIVFNENRELISILQIPVSFYSSGSAVSCCLYENYIVISDTITGQSFRDRIRLFSISGDFLSFNLLSTINSRSNGVDLTFNVGEYIFVIGNICNVYKIQENEIIYVKYFSGISFSNVKDSINNCKILKSDGHGCYYLTTNGSYIVCLDIIIQNDNVELNIIQSSFPSSQIIGVFNVDNLYFLIDNKFNFLFFSIIENSFSFLSMTNLVSNYSYISGFEFKEGNKFILLCHNLNSNDQHLFSVVIENGNPVIENDFGLLISNFGTDTTTLSRTFGSILKKIGNDFILIFDKVSSDMKSTEIIKVNFDIENESLKVGNENKVKSYSGSSMGFAKTGGNAGDTIQIYVPNES